LSGAASLGQRVLILAPTARDGSLTCEIMARAGVRCESFTSLDALCAALADGVGALLIPEEHLERATEGPLGRYLAAQPAWSDLPILMLAGHGATSPSVAAAMERLGNITVLERPTRIAALVSATRTALRARQRQYQIRDHLKLREVTERLLRQSVEEMQTLLQTLPIGVFIAHDPACRVITGNRAASQILRMPSGENLSTSPDNPNAPTHFRIRHDGREVAANALPVQRAARGEHVGPVALDYVFEDGSVVNTLVTAMPLYDAAGKPRGAVGAIMDMSAHLRNEAALREADKRKDEYLAILAHELRNPLAPIRNSVHLLRAATSHDTAASRVTEMMDRQVNVMVRLVDDLLDVSRITRGTISLRKEPVEIAAVVRRAVEASRALIEGSGHRMIVRVPQTPLVVDADPVRLDQVIANLLNNAGKYTDAGGEIRLTVEHTDDTVSISVRDTGVGIEPAKLAGVFELFMQVEPHGRRAQGGLGIGLTLVKQLMEMHGGTVEAHSEGPGRGSEFILRLPLIAPPRPSPAPAATHVDATHSARRVLVVDDNRDAAESLALLLQMLGATTRVESSGEDALRALAEFQPTLAIVDIGMPGMDGHEVARRVRARPEFDTVTLVALTGWGQAEDRRLSMLAGFDRHLTKPASLDDLQGLFVNGHARGPVTAGD
jgi:signal transduction histidine kinase/ActR/RegA family two-component response regulator